MSNYDSTGVVDCVGASANIGVQKDMGTGLALLGIVGTMLYVAGINKRMGAITLASMVTLGVAFNNCATPEFLE